MNPLLNEFQTPRGSYPFEEIKPEHFAPAFDAAIQEHYQEIDRIAGCSEPASFANTIVAIEESGQRLERVSSAFFNLLHSNSNEELEILQEEIIPRLSALSSYLSLHEKLFERVDSVWQERESLALDGEDARLLKNCYEGFIRSGARLNPKQKERLKQIDETLSKTAAAFGQNVLHDTKGYKMHLTEPKQVAGMPATVLTIAAEKALAEGHAGGWLFDLTGPSYSAFMMHCPQSHLRHELYMAKMRIGAADNEYNNEENIRTIVNARLEKAQLLGYKCYADYALEQRMLKTTQEVYGLLDELLGSDDAYKAKAMQEIDEISQWIETAHPGAAKLPLEIWDWSYWSQQYKEAHYQFDDEELRPYFELSSVIDALWQLAHRLYGIRIVESQDYQRYHPDVRSYEVYDHDGSYLALLYADFFPRPNKQSGAWKSSLVDQKADTRPQIMIVMNFSPPTSQAPALLSLDEVNTFLHEFGHALHAILSECRYASLSGTNVARDFVELPSQIMENWLDEKEFLDLFARHYQTGEPLPQELLDKLLEARNYLVGYSTCRQLSFGYLDMAWHSIRQPLGPSQSIKDFESAAWQRALTLPPSPPEAVMSCSFGHLFSGGYAAGYYGYKWAELLEADAYARFQEEGIFSPQVASDFRREILERGDSEEAMQLYTTFRGRRPTINALLEKHGLRGPEKPRM